MYDPVVNDWAIIEPRNIGGELKDVPPPMQEHASIVYKDLMVVVGGKDEQDIYLNSVYFFNLKTFKWYKLPIFSLGIPQGRSGHSVSLLKNDKLLIMGGDKFDYARIDDNDLHTSDINMGKGTILYTLDISRIEEMCPGIMDEVSTPVINDTMRYDMHKTVETPVQTQSTTSPGLNASPNNASPITKPNPINPVQVQNNILTPYSDRDRQNTPKSKNTEAFVDSAVASSGISETPLNKQTSATTSVHTARSPLADAVPVVSKAAVETGKDAAVPGVATAISPNAQEKRVSITSSGAKLDTQKSAKNSPFPDVTATPSSVYDNTPKSEVKADANTSPAAPAQVETSEDEDEFLDSRDNESEQLHKLDAVELSPAANQNVQSSPKSATTSVAEHSPSTDDAESEKIDSVIEEVQVVEDLNARPESEVAKSPVQPETHSKSDSETESESEEEEPDSEPEQPLSVPTVNKSIAAPVVAGAGAGTIAAATAISSTSNTTTIDKSVLENFRNELQKLRDVAKEKSLEASGHIRDLENQIVRLKTVNKKAVTNSSNESIASAKLQTQCDILTADNHAMRDRVLELESLLSDKFLDLENMNVIIKQQKAAAERSEANNINEEEVEELRLKCKVLAEENAQLKASQKVSDLSLNETVGSYSDRIDSLLVKWRDIKASDEGVDGEIPHPIAGYTPHHKQVVTKLSSQLDDLLQKSQDLTLSRDKLNEEYSELESKHQGTNDTLQSTIEELANVKKTYEDALATVTTKGEALEVSRKELSEYKQSNQKLQEQVDSLMQKTEKSTEQPDADITAQLKDLKAELFVISQERNSLKDETLALKKKLYTLEQ